tara:strand:+ start:236 stop:532 length:297 start_codon:yes stop_codon:yes gene_type:complete
MRYTLDSNNLRGGLLNVLDNGVATKAYAAVHITFSDECEVKRGTFYGGEFKGGESYHVLFNGGVFEGGTFEGGVFKDGVFEGGSFYVGVVNDRTNPFK